MNGRLPLNEKGQCKLCENYTDSTVNAKIFTIKELVMIET